jgi:hypothetical protein
MLNLDFGQISTHIDLIEPANLKWNVLKNLIYYSLKYSLLSSVTVTNDLTGRRNEDESLNFLLFSIVNYIESFAHF